MKDFHAMLQIHTDWLNNAEKILGSFKHPSKLVERVLKQMQDHRVCRIHILTIVTLKHHLGPGGQ